jgi:hypothetical protein
MLITTPRRSRSDGSAACVKSSGARRLRWNWRSNCSGVKSRTVERFVSAALFTSTSMPPKRRSAASISARQSSTCVRSLCW